MVLSGELHGICWMIWPEHLIVLASTKETCRGAYQLSLYWLVIGLNQFICFWFSLTVTHPSHSVSAFPLCFSSKESRSPKIIVLTRSSSMMIMSISFSSMLINGHFPVKSLRTWAWHWISSNFHLGYKIYELLPKETSLRSFYIFN